MSGEVSRDPCCGGMFSLGTFEGQDLASLDHLAVKLICLDSRFASALEQIGRLLGYRIAEQRHPTPVSFDTALSSLMPACGFEGAVGYRFRRRNGNEAVLEITGCGAALGWQIPRVDRAVCSYDAGLFEGFLRGATGEQAWSVRETACLGFGDADCCEFRICRQYARESVSQEQKQQAEKDS